MYVNIDLTDLLIYNHDNLQRFISATANTIRYFGSTSTSRIEGTYAMIKKFIKVSNGHVDIVVERIQDAIAQQLQQFQQQNAMDLLTRNLRINSIPFFNNVICNCKYLDT